MSSKVSSKNKTAKNKNSKKKEQPAATDSKKSKPSKTTKTLKLKQAKSANVNGSKPSKAPKAIKTSDKTTTTTTKKPKLNSKSSFDDRKNNKHKNKTTKNGKKPAMQWKDSDSHSAAAKTKAKKQRVPIVFTPSEVTEEHDLHELVHEHDEEDDDDDIHDNLPPDVSVNHIPHNISTQNEEETTLDIDSYELSLHAPNGHEARNGHEHEDVDDEDDDHWDEATQVTQTHTDADENDDDDQDARPKRKYRESDSLVKAMSYEDAKRIKDDRVRENYEKRLSKYDAVPPPPAAVVPVSDDDEDDDANDADDDKKTAAAPYKPILKDKVKQNKHGKHHGRAHGRGKGSAGSKKIRMSMTDEILQTAASAGTNTPLSKLTQHELSQMSRQELSLYYNKETQDRYDEFEMNTWSSESSDGNSENVTQRYLKDPLTPAPDDIEKKYAKKKAKKKKGMPKLSAAGQEEVAAAKRKKHKKQEREDPIEEEDDADEQQDPDADEDDEDDGQAADEDAEEGGDGFLSPLPTVNGRFPEFTPRTPDDGHRESFPQIDAQPPEIEAQMNEDLYEDDDGNVKTKTSKAEKKKKKKYTLKQFMSVDLEAFVEEHNHDNFDIAKALCKYFDEQCQDTDTVCIVADAGKGPNTSYWSKGDYNRTETDCSGKYIMVYRACKHQVTDVKVAQDIWESCVRGLVIDNLGQSQLISEKLDSLFGQGCHVSYASHDAFEAFCRYSDGYICELSFPNHDNAYCVAWRR